MSNVGPTRIQLDPAQVAALRELVQQRGIAEACRRTQLGRLAIGSILGMSSAPVAQAALLARAFGVGPSISGHRTMASAAGLRRGGRPY